MAHFTFRFWQNGGQCLALFFAMLSCIALQPLPAHADDTSSSMADMLQRMGESATPEENAPLPSSTTSPVNVEVQWRLWQRVAAGGSPGLSELQALRYDAVSLGIPSLPVHQLTLLAAARSPETFGFDEEASEQLIVAAHELAPHLPYANFELAHWRLSNAPTSPHRAIPPWVRGVQTSSQWLDTRVGWTLKAMAILLFALGLGFLGFLLGQLLRYFGIVAYDGTRILPRGFSSTQTVILLMALVLVPGLILQSPLLSMYLLLLLVIPFQQLNERLVTLCFMAVLAALPWIDDSMGQYITYPGSDAQLLLHAHYHGCDQECLPWLEELAADDDQVAGYALAVETFRKASQEEMAHLEQMLQSHLPTVDTLQGEWLNLQGAVLIARGNSEESLEVLDRAIAADPTAAAPWFNQMRALQILGDSEDSYVALEEAIRRDLNRVSRHLQTTRRDPPSYLMMAPIPPHAIWQAHAPSVEQAPSLITPFWTVLAGEKVDLSLTPIMGFVGIALVFLTIPLYWRRKVSSPCPKCGLARDPDDAADTGHHHYCMPCYKTFVSGATLDYHARVHSEATLGRRNRFQAFLRRALSLLTPGVGHILGGHAIRGVLTLCALVTGVLILFYPMGIWRISFELFREAWAGQTPVAWILISIAATVGLTAVLRGVEPTHVRSTTSKKADRP